MLPPGAAPYEPPQDPIPHLGCWLLVLAVLGLTSAAVTIQAIRVLLALVAR
jgi:hypothetical protein